MEKIEENSIEAHIQNLEVSNKLKDEPGRCNVVQLILCNSFVEDIDSIFTLKVAAFSIVKAIIAESQLQKIWL